MFEISGLDVFPDSLSSLEHSVKNLSHKNFKFRYVLIASHSCYFNVKKNEGLDAARYLGPILLKIRY